MNDSLLHTKQPDPHQDTYSRNVIGFWTYLMTDSIIFATLFATYAILHQSTFGGPGPSDLFKLSTALAETLVLLLSSFTSGLALLATYKKQPRNHILTYLFITFLLGLTFVGIEVSEFVDFVKEGYGPSKSAFLSSFFTLVGTHGLHVSTGLLWIAVMMGQIFFVGLNATTFRRLVCFNMFWHFLDLVWIFIFTFVYLMGVNSA